MVRGSMDKCCKGNKSTLNFHTLLNKFQVNPGSPASNAGIKIGDSLVQVGDDLVLFMNLSQVNNLLLKEQLQLSLTIER